MITSINLSAVKAICSWEYPEPYNVYDYMCFDEAVRNNSPLLNSDNKDNYLCFWNDVTLVAYTSIIPKGENLYIGIGVAPQFCGQGMGETLLNQTIIECKRRYSPCSVFAYSGHG